MRMKHVQRYSHGMRCGRVMSRACRIMMTNVPCPYLDFIIQDLEYLLKHHTTRSKFNSFTFLDTAQIYIETSYVSKRYVFNTFYLFYYYINSSGYGHNQFLTSSPPSLFSILLRLCTKFDGASVTPRINLTDKGSSVCLIFVVVLYVPRARGPALLFQGLFV